MAEFCNQCCDEMKFPHDFDHVRGRFARVICEGCGIIVVDPRGYCTGLGCKHQPFVHLPMEPYPAAFSRYQLMEEKVSS